MFDALWINARLITCEAEVKVLESYAVGVQDEKIAWIGPMSALQTDSQNLAKHIYNVEGRLLTPGLIDCHTHLVYAGNRAQEFNMRLQGKTYEEIAKSGGGIQATVQATRLVSEETLLQQSLQRAHALQKSGVTTLEIKSGYGLDLETEIKLLRVAKKIADNLPLTICTTFLGAHTIPYEYQTNPDAYVDYVCNEMIPAIAQEKLADAVDVFCETIAFNLTQTERIFTAAKDNGLAVKCHAEQLSDSGAAVLAAKYHARSVDHLEYLKIEHIQVLKKSNTVAVLLPGAYYFLRENQLPPVEALRAQKVPIAIASDCNPGTSPVLSLQLMLNMACTLFHLTPEEALLGVTQHAAKAIGLETKIGSISLGKEADFAIWNVADPIELSYYLGGNPLNCLIKKGIKVI